MRLPRFDYRAERVGAACEPVSAGGGRVEIRVGLLEAGSAGETLDPVEVTPRVDDG